MKKIVVPALVSVVMLGLAACSDSNPASLPPGHYQNSTTNTNAAGTNTSADTMTDVNMDENGNKTAVVTKKTTKDPKGLFNKSTSTTKKVYTNQ